MMFKCEVLKRLDRIEAKLNKVLALVSVLLKMEKDMSAELDALTADVASLSDVATSVEAVLAGLSQQIRDLATAGGTPAQFAALATQIDTAKARIAAAVTANTPAAPTP